MDTIIEVRTEIAPKPMPVFSQAIKANGMGEFVILEHVLI